MYKPTTTQVRQAYVAAAAEFDGQDHAVSRGEFDTWLLEHERETAAAELESIAALWETKHGMSWLSMQAQSLRARASILRGMTTDV